MSLTVEDRNKIVAAIMAGQSPEAAKIPDSEEARDFWKRVEPEVKEIMDKGGVVSLVDDIPDPR